MTRHDELEIKVRENKGRQLLALTRVRDSK